MQRDLLKFFCLKGCFNGMKKVFMAALLLVTMMFTGCGGGNDASKTDGDSKEIKKITIGLDDEYAPMGFKDEQNEIVGFDVDLAKEAAKRLGCEVEFKAIDWNSKEVELKSGTGLTLRPNVNRTCFSAILTWIIVKSFSLRKTTIKA